MATMQADTGTSGNAGRRRWAEAAARSDIQTSRKTKTKMLAVAGAAAGRETRGGAAFEKHSDGA